MSAYTAGLLAEIGIGGIAALGVYVILATGQLSLGNAAFMAIGAYTAGWLTVTHDVGLTAAVLAGRCSAESWGCWWVSRHYGCAASISPWRRSASAR
jgi:branched-chain amino acid transport system permease protein